MLRHSSFSYNEALAKFHEQLQRCTLTAYCGREFILITKLKQWLKCDSPIPGKTWLGLLLPTEPTQLEPSVSERMLTHSNALITFCILLNLSRTKYLETFIRVNFVDSKLPIYLSALRSELNDAQIDEAEFLAESFAKEQWKFCPATFELEGTDNYIQNWILPITNYEPINEKGGTADLWQIEVPEDFVGETLRAEVPRSRYKGPDGHEWQYKFALKCFQSSSVEQFDHEKTAFANLRKHNGVVRCFANYSHTDQHKNRTHNLLLEYGDSDLEVYFVTHHPPFLEPEVFLFWSELFEVVTALESIHNPKPLDDGRTFKGWHADIKPDNILFIKGKFKLADPGFVEFLPHTIENPETILSGCTWTYSAPEHRPKRKVSQKIDIWSFGCVFSIAATWVAGGHSAARDFTKIRQKAVNHVIARNDSSRPGILPGDLFHDGSCVLKDVTEWHRVLRNQVRRADRLTGLVLDLVDESMLLERPEDRIDSRTLCNELKKILDTRSDSLSEPMSSSLRDALLEIDEEASEFPAMRDSSSTQKLTDSTGKAVYRKSRKSQILSIPLKKTAHRSEHLTSISPPLDLQKPSTPKTHHRAISARTLLTPSTSPRSHAPHKPQNFYQVLNAIKRRDDNLKDRIFRTSRIDGTLAKYFKDRDIRFLIDNGSSMQDHWDQATILLELLVTKAAGLDKNGMDASFTCGNAKVDGEKEAKNFRKVMLKQGVQPQAGVHTDMRSSLGFIFENHIHYLKNHLGPKKHLTLIIFTDGLWEGTPQKDTVKEKIAEFIKMVVTIRGKLINRPVSLQFVQFGHDVEATFRLQYMDDELRYEVDDIDVIDTESADGDIIKILLGSFVEEYDNLEHQMSPGLSEPPINPFQ